MKLTGRGNMIMHQYGASTTLRNNAALTAEDEACVNNSTRCKSFLSAYSAAPELHRAAMLNDITTILRILDKAPKRVHSVDGNGCSALHVAASSGYAAACKVLCEVRPSNPPCLLS